MNIFLVSHEFFLDGAHHHGGIATYTRNLSQLLVSHGCQVTVITLSDTDDNRVEWNGVAVERVKVPQWAYQLKKLLKCKAGEYITCAFLIRRRIDRLLRHQKPDVIHYANFKAVGLLRRKDIPCVIRMSSDNVLWREAFKTHYNYEEAFAQVTVDDRLELYAVRRADGVFAPSKLVAKITAERICREVKVIESPAPIPAETVSLGKNRMEGKRYLLYYGSLSRMKGIHTIGEILSDILAADPDLYFVFIGHDYHLRFDDRAISCASYLRERAGCYQDRVIIEDHLEPKELYPIIEGAICCVFPSRIDNLPNTCLEAMSFNKPIIATNGASFDQVITDSFSGMLTEIDDPPGLRSAVCRMLALSVEDRAWMGHNAYLRALECRGDVIYPQVMNFYKEVMLRYEANRSTAIP